MNIFDLGRYVPQIPYDVLELTQKKSPAHFNLASIPEMNIVADPSLPEDTIFIISACPTAKRLARLTNVTEVYAEMALFLKRPERHKKHLVMIKNVTT